MKTIFREYSKVPILAAVVFGFAFSLTKVLPILNWDVLDHAFWQTLIACIAIVAAYVIGQRQITMQDTIELYCSFGLIDHRDTTGMSIQAEPFIHIQNVGTRLVYLDYYIFNGREYSADAQILPPTYSQALNNFYRVNLPTNDEVYVCLEVAYHDLDGRSWISKVIATKGGSFGWSIKTLPRIPRK